MGHQEARIARAFRRFWWPSLSQRRQSSGHAVPRTRDRPLNPGTGRKSSKSFEGKTPRGRTHSELLGWRESGLLLNLKDHGREHAHVVAHYNIN